MGTKAMTIGGVNLGFVADGTLRHQLLKDNGFMAFARRQHKGDR